MIRNQRTTAGALQVGDRFYKLNDKKKTVQEIVGHEPIVTKYQTYSVFCIKDGGNPRYPDKMKSNTEVIFLRHKQ